MCYTQKKKDQYSLGVEQITIASYKALLMIICQVVLLFCMIKEIMEQLESYMPNTTSIEIYIAKFVTSVAMHLFVFREFERGFRMMKFAMNNPDAFY